jgi:hypothetical protein
VGAALVLGGATAVPAASDDGDAAASRPAASSPWYGHLFGSKAPAAEKKPEKEKLPPQTVTPRHAPVTDDAATVRAREEAALLRRMEVCDKLKQIAEHDGDAELGRLAEQLEQRANNLYFQRIAHLPASRATPDLDEYLLDKHEQKSGLDTMPSSPLPHAVPGADSRHAAGRGEEP